MGRSWQSVLVLLALAAAVAVLLLELRFFFEFGRFNIDEGMHLGAGRLIFADGLLPYRDFPFSQGPGGPFFYGALGNLFGSTLWVGRLGSLAAGLVCFGAMLVFATRMAGATAALVVAALLVIESPAIWMFTQVRTEPVSVALAMLAVLAFTGRRDTALRAALPSILLVWATSFRITYLALLAVSVLMTAWELRGSSRRLVLVLALIAANALVAALPLLAFPSESFFHVFVAQALRAERLGWSELPASARFWFFLQPETSYRAVLLLLPLPLLTIFRDRRRPESRARSTTLILLLAAAATVYLPHLWFRFGFFQYFEHAALLAILAIGIAAGAFLQGAPSPAARLGVLAWIALAWWAGALDVRATLPVWTDPNQPTVARFAPLRDEIATALPDGCEMLTFESHLALEAGCRVTPGLEYSYFSFFPELSAADAGRRGVLNREALLGRIRTQPPEFVALTREAAERISGISLEEGQAPRVPGMTRYRPWRRLRIPIGPLLTFWNDVTVYARDDVAEALAPSPGNEVSLDVP